MEQILKTLSLNGTNVCRKLSSSQDDHGDSLENKEQVRFCRACIKDSSGLWLKSAFIVVATAALHNDRFLVYFSFAILSFIIFIILSH